MLPARVPTNGRHSDPAFLLPEPVAPSTPVVPVAVPKKTPHSLSAIPDTGALLASLRRRWLLALVLGVGTMLGSAYFLWTYLPFAYTVRTLLHVASNRPTTGILPGYSDSLLDFTNFQKTQIAIIKSRLILSTALGQPQVKALPLVRAEVDPIEWLDRELKVDYKLAPEVLSIAMSGTDPQQLAVIVTAVRDAYLSQVVNKERNQKEELLQRLQKFFSEKEQLMKNNRNKLRNLADSVGSRDAQTLAHKHQFAIERLELARRELMQLQSDLRRAEITQATEAKQGRDELLIADKDVEEEIQKDETIKAHLAEIARQEQAVEQVRQVTLLGDKDPSLVAYKSAIEASREAIRKRRAELRPAIVALIRNKFEKEQAESRRKQQKEVAIAQELEKRLKEEVEGLQKEAYTINKGTQDLESVKEEIAQAEDIAKRINGQMDALRVELQAPSRVSLLEDATASHAEEDKKRFKVVSVGSFGSFAIVLFGLAVWDYRGRRINRASDVSQGLGLTVLAELPRLTKREVYDTGKWQTSDDHYVYDQWIEAVNAARTMILHAVRNDSVKTVMVASALEGEGKTSLACHLAASLAHKFGRVLIVDADLRKPQVHKRFHVPDGPGLSELLRGEIGVDVAVRPTQVKNLSMISAGQCDYQAIQALAQDRTQEVLAALKEKFDFIVVDTSPLLHVADPLILAPKVDAVLFSVLREVSRLPAVYSAYEKVLMLGVRVLGTIVHGMPRGKRGYRYSLPGR